MSAISAKAKENVIPPNVVIDLIVYSPKTYIATPTTNVIHSCLLSTRSTNSVFEKIRPR